MVIKARENLIGAWAFLIGIVLAVIIGISNALVSYRISPYLSAFLAFLGLVVGYFVSEKNVQTFLLASVALVLVSSAGLQGLLISAAVGGVDIGLVISSILGALLFLFVPSTIIVALKTVFSIAKS